MPSAQEVSQNPAHAQRLTKRDNRVSWGLILTGIILLILSLLMFLYVKGYRPSQKKFVFEGRIERIPPTARAGNSPLLLTHSSDSLSPPKAVWTSDKREFIEARRILNHATPTPTPEQINQEKKPNIVRRFFNWLAGLFKNRKQARNLPNSPPVISTVTLSETTLVLEPNCAQGLQPARDCALTAQQVQVRVAASDADNDELRYKPIAQVGKLSGDKENITWDLSGVSPGAYTLNVSASDGRSESGLYPVTVNVRRCGCYRIFHPVSPCPYPVSISAPATATSGSVIAFSSDVGYSGESALNYAWTIAPASAHIISGAGTPSITVDTTGLVAQPLTATLVVDDGSGASACRQTAKATTQVFSPPPPLSVSTMSGRVVDKNGVAVQGATVTLIGDNGLRRSLLSDANGEYRFENLPPGNYRVEVVNTGFNKAVWEVALVEGMNPTFEFRLPGSDNGGLVDPNRTPTPTPSPTPTSSPTPTPSTTPTPPVLKVKKQDEIRVYYPERFLKDTEGEVTFELEQVLREVVSAEINIEGKIEVRSKPAAIPGVAAGTPLAEAFEGYDAYATVRLIPNGLAITSEPTVAEQLLTDKLARWVWRLKPTGEDGTEATFRFELTVIWRTRNGTLPEKIVPNVWPHEPFKVTTGPPLTVKAAGYTAPVSLGGGVVALGLGALQKRRRRLSGEEEIEEETIATVEEPEDEVSSTVYAPTEALPGDSFLVQVFVHLPEQAAGLDELAKEADDAAKQRMTAELKKKIKRGTELAFHLKMPGLEIDEPVQSCLWEGEPECVQFGVTIPQERRPGNIIGTVIVSEASIPIGHLKFKFKIAGEVSQAAPINQVTAVGNMTRYRQAFISYTSADRAEVLKRVQMLNLVNVKFFQDLLTLEPGDAWEKLLYQYIDQSDVFYLFWSKAASESQWVRKEVAYAIKRKGGNEEAAPEIVPVIIEGPPAAKPPEELNFLHFNDKFIYFIDAEKRT